MVKVPVLVDGLTFFYLFNKLIEEFNDYNIIITKNHFTYAVSVFSEYLKNYNHNPEIITDFISHYNKFVSFCNKILDIFETEKKIEVNLKKNNTTITIFESNINCINEEKQLEPNLLNEELILVAKNINVPVLIIEEVNQELKQRLIQEKIKFVTC